MLAIMGGSGAGKTSLLDVLTLKVTGQAQVEGSIMLNAKPLTQQRFQKCAAYVAQESLLWSQLSTHETLRYVAELYSRGASAHERAELIEEVLSQTGLKSCEHTLVGDLYRKGLSGGQKKRLCIAEALVKKPAMLVLDEPTSALDSAAAFEVARLLHGLAKTTNMVVLCTIHQPSHRVYGFFDDTLVLAAGRVAYCGPTQDALEHMTSLGLPPLSSGMSLPEYLLDVTNADFTDADRVEKILDSWKPLDTSALGTDSVAVREVETRGIMSQSLILGSRLTRMTLRDPTLYSARWMFLLVSNTVFSVVYMDAGDRNQSQVLPRIWLISWSLGAPAFMSVICIAVYSNEFHIYGKERRNSMYGTTAALVSQAGVMLPAVLVLSFCGLAPLYLVVGFSRPVFMQMWLAHAAFMVWAECLAQLLAVCIPHFLLGMVAYIGVMFIAFLQNGAIISIGSITWALRWIHFINPWFLCLRAMVTLDFIGSFFEGFGSQGESCEGHPAPCFGHEGADVLDGVGQLLSTFGSDHSPGYDIAIAACLALILKLTHYLALIIQSRR
jgi:ABC-type multidrug transport system ATPase subunit